MSSNFVVRLKNLASTCKFETFLNEAMRDRLVCGLNKSMSRTQMSLLSQADLTYELALQKCLAAEMAERANVDMSGSASSSTAEVHRIQGRKKAFKQHSDDNGNANTKCKCCGRKNHRTDNCRFKDAVCHACNVKGHIKPVCPNQSKNATSDVKNKKSVKYVEMDGNSGDDDVDQDACDYGLNSLFEIKNDLGNTANTVKPYNVQVLIDNKPLSMELDSGAVRSTISERVYQANFAHIPINQSKLVFKSYSGDVIPMLGCIDVKLDYQGQKSDVTLFVVKGSKPCLLGRDIMSNIKLNWKQIVQVHKVDKMSASNENNCNASVDTILKSYKDLFVVDNKGIRDFRAKLTLKNDAIPKYQKSRPVPYAMTDKVDKAYEKLIKNDILYPVEYSEWASPAVLVPKSESDEIRVCGDYKYLNENLENDGYKLPNVQDLFAMFARDGAPPKYFSLCDLSGAFNQLLLDDQSGKLLSLNTHRGLLAAKRLCFGVKTAPAIFQATMDKILAGIPQVFVYIDDVLLATETESQHLKILKLVFERFAKYNVKLNRDKCIFMKPEVQYLGHVVNGEGIKPVQGKVDAILNCPKPTNMSELKSYLGMVNYYGKFIENVSATLQPLYFLLTKPAKWFW